MHTQYSKNSIPKFPENNSDKSRIKNKPSAIPNITRPAFRNFNQKNPGLPPFGISTRSLKKIPTTPHMLKKAAVHKPVRIKAITKAPTIKASTSLPLVDRIILERAKKMEGAVLKRLNDIIASYFSGSYSDKENYLNRISLILDYAKQRNWDRNAIDETGANLFDMVLHHQVKNGAGKKNLLDLLALHNIENSNLNLN